MFRFSYDTTAIRQQRRTMGWRLYATNATESKLSLTQAVQLHRASPRIERNFARLKGKQLGIRPMYVQREDHLVGLVRLLSLALRVLTGFEYGIRRRLAHLGKSLSGFIQQPLKERLQNRLPNACSMPFPTSP